MAESTTLERLEAEKQRLDSEALQAQEALGAFLTSRLSPGDLEHATALFLTADAASLDACGAFLELALEMLARHLPGQAPALRCLARHVLDECLVSADSSKACVGKVA